MGGTAGNTIAQNAVVYAGSNHSIIANVCRGLGAAGYVGHPELTATRIGQLGAAAQLRPRQLKHHFVRSHAPRSARG
jgi:hypothetical protein